MCVCVCVCVCERERERERECVYIFLLLFTKISVFFFQVFNSSCDDVDQGGRWNDDIHYSGKWKMEKLEKKRIIYKTMFIT